MPTPSPLRIAVLGCGQIADAHLSQLRRIPAAEVVAVCDVYEDLAYQAAARFAVPRTFTSLERMLDDTRPDVVHVTTPAHTHAPLAMQLMEAGCHVYVEKPFTLDCLESEKVLATAARTGRFVCVGHDQLFDPIWLTAKEWLAQQLIGEVLHIESVLGYPLAGSFGARVAGDPQHWVHRLPGGLFQNTISHPLYRITDLMETDQPSLHGHWATRPGFNFPTEMNLALAGSAQTGTLTFSTFLPPQRITRIYGQRGTLELDFDAQTIRWNRQLKLPGAFAKLEAVCRQFGNACWNAGHTALRFLRADIHYFAGMKTLFERFYDSIRTGSPLPIPHHEAQRVTLLMDRIFAHCRDSAESVRPSTLRVDNEEQNFSHRSAEAVAVTAGEVSF
ncbi:Gfo/Idh/MocA family protein [Planctomicrobium sp. SH664]|uniref:Gfo/Idh/MocA family protein n=1 Tax=Planctomicrobium sp. SH664 TaxID=3448125 RepID=UPI003F5AFAD4